MERAGLLEPEDRFAIVRRFFTFLGGVAEWSKAHAWKVCRRVTVSRVRIPPPPPAHKARHGFYGDMAAVPIHVPRAGCTASYEALNGGCAAILEAGASLGGLP